MTQFNAPTYDIERPTGTCVFTGRKLEPGQAYMAVLVEYNPPKNAPAKPGTSSSSAAGLGLKRLDVSVEAWESGQRPQQIFSYWKSVVPEPNQKKKVFVDDDVLMSIFKRLGEAVETERRAFRFVLGLILMRKKQLRYDGSQARIGVAGEKEEWWTMMPRGGSVALEMINPHLDEARIQQVREQLSEILAGEL